MQALFVGIRSAVRPLLREKLSVPLRAFSTTNELRSPARVQHAAPSFSAQAVVDGGFKEVKLEQFKGKWVYLLFYPLDFTFVCPTELIAFSDRLDEFKKLDAEVIGVSTDSHFSHLAWTKQPRKQGGIEGLRYPLVADFKKQISADYGILVEAAGLALRGLFLIDPKGIVRHITINDTQVGRSVDEALRVLQAFQHVEKHGEVCPANWKQEDGSAGAMKPDPKGALKYFEKAAKK